MKIVKAEIGRLNQGTIFSCAGADRYEGCCVAGLIITARCDFAQDKFPVVNYVPLVPFDEWLRRDGLEIILDRCTKSLDADVLQLLKDWGIAASVLVANPFPEVVEMHLSTMDEKQRKKPKERADKLVSKWNAIRGKAKPVVQELESTFPAIVRDLVKELVNHKLVGHYFFPTILPDEQNRRHVALLREASFLPRQLALELGRGILKDAKVLHQNPDWGRWLKFSGQDEFAAPLGQIQPPFTEHL